MIKVVVTGYTGKVGSVVYRYLQNQSDIEVIGGFNSSNYKGLPELVKRDKPHFVVDFSVPEATREIVKIAAENDISVVTGTTGFSQEDEELFKRIAQEKKVLIAWVPNFSIGANLMMEFSQTLARFFDEAEVVEMHHKTKRDKPSGTAKLTASLIEEEWRKREHEEKVNISSLRLSSAIAHQWVLFSGEDEIIVVEHHTLSRLPFAKGVHVALKKIFPKLNQLKGSYIKGMLTILKL